MKLLFRIDASRVVHLSRIYSEKHVVRRFFSIIRLADWRYSFLPFIAALCYLSALIFNIQYSTPSLRLLLLFLITSIGFSALGYLVNEYFDRETDQVAGKTNRLVGLSRRQIYSLFMFSQVLALLPWIWLPSDFITLKLLVAELMLLFLYSVPFIRLKAIWYLSALTDTLYAYVLPCIICIHTMALYQQQDWTRWSIGGLLITVALIGYRNILQHQYHDRFHDERAGIITLPLKVGEPFLKHILGLLLAGESVLLIGCMMLFRMQQSWLLLVVPAYVAYMIFHILIGLRVYGKKELVLHFSNNQFYQVYLPIICLLILISKDVRWTLVLALHLLLLTPFHIHAYYFFLIRHVWRTSLLLFRRIVSFAVNHTIYYVFCLFGVDLKKENTSAVDYLKKKWRRM